LILVYANIVAIKDLTAFVKRVNSPQDKSLHQEVADGKGPQNHGVRNSVCSNCRITCRRSGRFVWLQGPALRRGIQPELARYRLLRAGDEPAVLDDEAARVFVADLSGGQNGRAAIRAF
jgi:hypothetical protein